MVQKTASSPRRSSRAVNVKGKGKAKSAIDPVPSDSKSNGSDVPEKSPRKRTHPKELAEDEHEHASNKKPKSASPAPERNISVEAPTENVSKGISESVPVTPEKKGSAEEKRFPSPPQEAANALDKENWQGFCDIESDPDYFSVMVREMGVNGVVVREVFGLDYDTLKFTLPQPIYGLILLYRYREGPEADQEANCPDNVWFANQLPAQNSCATLAMINILMNTPEVDLGENLSEFKKFTSDMTPFHRGEALASFRFVKRIHNSFAKKMDMLESDNNLAIKARKNIKGRRNSDDSNTSIEENAHHFVAFLPVDGEVWKLDGYDRNPTTIGDYRGSWLPLAADKITEVMTSAGDGDYTVLALCKSPVTRLRQELSASFVACQLIESRLDTLSPGWRSSLPAEGSAPCSPNILQSLGVKSEQTTSATVPIPLREEIEALDADGLLLRRGAVIAEQQVLQGDILEQMDVEAAEDMKAKERRWDYGPAIKVWLERLAANGYLEANLHRFM